MKDNFYELISDPSISGLMKIVVSSLNVNSPVLF
jgi:hypothetical protein